MRFKSSVSRYCAYALVPLLLSACGGGGGGGSNPPSVNSARAILDSNNVQAFVSATELALGIALTTEIGPSAIFPQSGCIAGTATFSFTSDASNNVTGTGSYTGFDNCVILILNGQVNVVSGEVIGSQINNLQLSFTDLKYTRRGTSETFQLSGTIDLVWKPSVMGSAGYIMTIDATARDAQSNTLFILEGFAVDSDISAGQQDILINGKLTLPISGFVDINSFSRIRFFVPGESPDTGEFVLTGATSRASVVYLSGMHPVITFGPLP